MQTSWPIVGRDSEGTPIIEAYGTHWPLMSDAALELTCYRTNRQPEVGGLGKFRHLMNAHMLIWPQLTPSINEWMVRRFQAFCSDHSVITLAGGASTAKSTDTARFALLHWWSLPEANACIVCSTTITALLKRIWSYITEYKHAAAFDMPGIISNSPPPKMMFSRMDPKHGIHGAALKEGGSERTLADLIGIHPNNELLMVVDEATDVTPAVVDAPANLDNGLGKFKVILIGNSKSRTDPHGRLSEPLAGWDSIDPDVDEVWETKEGVCLYFDCYKSPAVMHPEDDNLWFLINKNKIQREAERLGQDDPKFWRFIRGFWPPEDFAKTVMTRTLLRAHNAFDKAEFSGDWVEHVAALDPAFTSDGDEAILRFARVGPMVDGRIGIELGDVLSLKLNVNDPDPTNYQLVKLTKDICLERGIKPKFVGVDTWGFGSGAGDIFEKKWSTDIRRVVSVGAPTDSFVDSDMVSKAYEQYDRRATELWFMIKEFVQSGQLRGLDEETADELCSREYEWKGKKISLETKKDYKKRMGKENGPDGSPDRADALSIIIDVVRFALGVTPGSREALEIDDKNDWERHWETMLHAGNGGVDEDWESSWDVDALTESEMFS